MVNDQVLGYLARRMAAPTPEVTLVDISQELIDSEPEMDGFLAGLAHGTCHLRNCSDKAGIQHFDVAANRPRFASLAVMYGWMVANDHQYIYRLDQSHIVFSVDHGHFLPGGPDWTVQQLSQTGPPAPDSQIVGPCGLNANDLDGARYQLAVISDETIAEAVSLPPDEWGLTYEERCELAAFLAQRRDQLLVDFRGREA